MKPDDSISAELGPHLEAGEAADIDLVAARLQAAHPIPRAAFRASLRARLSHRPTDRIWPKARLRAHVAAYAAASSLLFAVAALGLADIGPLAP